MVIICGLQKTSMVDFPGKVACTVFLPNCDFRCPFCQNPSLINDVTSLPVIPEEEFFGFLDSRKEWLDGVCITGGEPCLSKDLELFIKKIKYRGFSVKLDTNGSMPQVLKPLFKAKLLDFVAMDIKASQDKYSEAAGVKVDLAKINESIKMIQDSGVDYEFRTTILPRLHSKQDLLIIGEWLKGSKAYYLQQFRNDFGVLDPSWNKEESYPRKELEAFVEMLKPCFEKVGLRD